MTDGRTHWAECWKEHGHSKCAVEHVKRLNEYISNLELEMADLEEELDAAYEHTTQRKYYDQ